MADPDPAHLCVGVVVPSLAPAAWIGQAVANLAATGAHVVVRVVSGPATGGLHGWSRVLCAIGGARMLPDPDAAGPLSALAGVHVVDDFADVDVVFHVGVAGYTGAETAPMGVWDVHVSGWDTGCDAGLQETLQDDGAVDLGLRRVDAPGWLRPSASRVQRLSPATTRARALWRAAVLPARALGDLLARRDTDTPAATVPAHRPLSAAVVLRGSTRLARRAVATGVRRQLARNEWFVA
ncbi:MAG: hypothetical protein O2782_02130 [bacterium]|nr:hypothetical protein [bacterium]